MLNLVYVVHFCAGVDQCIQRFLDVARQTECFFLQKRLQLSVQKPEQVVKEVMYSTHLQLPTHVDSFETTITFHCINPEFSVEAHRKFETMDLCC